MTLNANPSVIDDLVVANHILVNEGVLDGFGHISVRNERNPEHFLIARSMAPGLVTAADIVSCDLEGNVHDEQGRHTYVERFIHSEIYRCRPDVMAVIHSHSPAIITFGVTGARLRPICHMSGFLGAQVPVFEIRNAGGENTDLLIRIRHWQGSGQRSGRQFGRIAARTRQCGCGSFHPTSGISRYLHRKQCQAAK